MEISSTTLKLLTALGSCEDDVNRAVVTECLSERQQQPACSSYEAVSVGFRMEALTSLPMPQLIAARQLIFAADLESLELEAQDDSTPPIQCSRCVFLQVSGWIECAVCGSQGGDIEEAVEDFIVCSLSSPALYWQAWQIVVDVFLSTGELACQRVGAIMDTKLCQVLKNHAKGDLPVAHFYPAHGDLVAALHQTCISSELGTVNRTLEADFEAAASDEELRSIWALAMLSLQWHRIAAIEFWSKDDDASMEAITFISLLVSPFDLGRRSWWREEAQNHIRSVSEGSGGQFESAAGLDRVVAGTYELCRPQETLPTLLLFGLLRNTERGVPHLPLFEATMRAVQRQISSEAAVASLCALGLEQCRGGLDAGGTAALAEIEARLAAGTVRKREPG